MGRAKGLAAVESVAKLEIFYGGSKTYIPKNFYRTGWSKTYIPKNFYTKTTHITLLTEKFGGSGSPPGPFKASPLGRVIDLAHSAWCHGGWYVVSCRSKKYYYIILFYFISKFRNKNCYIIKNH
ncbi:hypothetical protein Hanom_Chr16g01462241 [Helianthus anomalus]